MVKNVEDITFNYVYRNTKKEGDTNIPFLYQDTEYMIVIASDTYPEYPTDKYFIFIKYEAEYIDYLINTTLSVGFKFKKDAVEYVIDFIKGEYFAEIHNTLKNTIGY